MSESPKLDPDRFMLSLNRFSMWTPAPGVENKRARLSFGLLDINPRISVFTSIPDDTIGKGVISAGMNPETFFIFLSRLEAITKAPPGTKEKIECYQGREKLKSSDVIFGKDSDGMIWLSVIAPNRPNIKFIFELSNYHNIIKSDGTELSKAELSAIEAQAKISILRKMYTNYFTEISKLPLPVYKKPGQQTPSKGSSQAAPVTNFDDVDFEF